MEALRPGRPGSISLSLQPLPRGKTRGHLRRNNMASFNKIIVVGYLGRDPELRYTPDGTPVCNFSVATTERRKDKSGEFRDVTTWFTVNMWGRQAEVANQYLAKGKQVYIEGRL